MIVRTTVVLKKSWNRERGDHDALVSNVGPGILAGMNLIGSGLLSFSSLLCQLISSSLTLEVADPTRARLGFANLCDNFLLDCIFSSESESDEDGDG